jgi:hypothetical protein
MGIVEGGQQLKAMGWGHGLKTGDMILLQNEGGSTRYQIAEVKYLGDPADMWSATLEFAPRPVSGEPVVEFGGVKPPQ